jgi:hypothetical protein
VIFSSFLSFLYPSILYPLPPAWPNSLRITGGGRTFSALDGSGVKKKNMKERASDFRKKKDPPVFLFFSS